MTLALYLRRRAPAAFQSSFWRRRRQRFETDDDDDNVVCSHGRDDVCIINTLTFILVVIVGRIYTQWWCSIFWRRLTYGAVDTNQHRDAVVPGDGAFWQRWPLRGLELQPATVAAVVTLPSSLFTFGGSGRTLASLAPASTAAPFQFGSATPSSSSGASGTTTSLFGFPTASATSVPSLPTAPHRATVFHWRGAIWWCACHHGSGFGGHHCEQRYSSVYCPAPRRAFSLAAVAAAARPHLLQLVQLRCSFLAGGSHRLALSVWRRLN